jgi:hypothetical protein
MAKRIKYNKVLLFMSMAFLLLLPLVIKANHHVDDTICREKKVLHFHSVHLNCLVCKFDYPVFSNEPVNEKSPKQTFSELYTGDCCSSVYQLPLKHSFLLRAPPSFTNIEYTSTRMM